MKSEYDKRKAFYHTPAWRKLRKIKITNDPLCEHCKRNGLIVPGYAIDHILPIADRPDLALDYPNLQTLCLSCHSTKTMEENKDAVHGKEAESTMDALLKVMIK